MLLKHFANNLSRIPLIVFSLIAVAGCLPSGESESEAPEQSVAKEVMPACADCLDFGVLTTSSYSDEDKDSVVTILDGGLSIRLENNTWRQTDMTYTITPNTVLEFTFESSVEGEIQGIGFDDNNAIENWSPKIFRLYGTQNWGIADFAYTGPGPETFTIPVGQYYTGSGFRLVMANDDDAGIAADGTFSNIRVYEGAGASTPPSNPPGQNSAPVISGSPSSQGTVGSAYSFQPQASDADGDSLAFSVVGLPSWASFSETTGEVSGTPGDGDVGTYTGISITVTDGDASATLGPFSITINAITTGSVTLSWTPPTQNTDGSALTDLAGYRIYYGTSSGSYTESVTLDNAGLSSLVVEGLLPGEWYFVSTAINVAGIESNYSNEAVKTVM